MKEIFSAGVMINSIYITPSLVVLYEKNNYLIFSIRFIKYFIDITVFDKE
jgi:hypothetical protein